MVTGSADAEVDDASRTFWLILVWIGRRSVGTVDRARLM